MNESITPSGSNPIRGADGAGQPGAKRTAEASKENPAFRVLLERLQAQAQELEEKTGELEKPEHLAAAVDIARASLDDALSLSDRLLEAFREAQHQTPDAAPEEDEA